MTKAGFIMGIALLEGAILLAGACGQQTPPPTPTPPVVYSEPELEYLLISNFGDVFYVDFDFYPVAREGQEAKNALEQFPVISANVTEFSAILAHLGLPNKAEYTPDEKLVVYREHKKLTLGVQMTGAGNVYNFVLRIGEDQGELIQGTITASGKITVLKREPSFNTYPICLAAGTLVDTPDGRIPVEQLQTGMSVWTLDDSGNRISAVIVKTTRTPVPSGFRVVRVTLSDGRSVTASPGHPSAAGRALVDYEVGEIMDGAKVIAVQSLTYDAGATYDILPAGSTGLYRANGILLLSTLK